MFSMAELGPNVNYRAIWASITPATCQLTCSENRPGSRAEVYVCTLSR